MEVNDQGERFIHYLTEGQGGLYAYLVSLLGDLHEAHNVLQETNLVLWRKAGEFEEGTDFGAWSRKVAYFQVLAHLRDRKRDRHIFDADLMSQIAERPDPKGDQEQRRLALRHCLAQLPEEHRKLINLRYAGNGSIERIANAVGKSQSAIKMSLLRVRQALMRCVEGKLAET
ncbi:ECF RNA polymerase sigma factor SigE [Planctomycetes bacterium Pan216]|uniref:ECF RNA polymerase sigma factor SigE n=1 Tax=Kolteria novifilia TaxID=2527975 RepID=A0A518B4C5_9BACT|nr:ECF RNA polymerase sigma factor SigE [Planctomycetes bacterium Pan216]